MSLEVDFFPMQPLSKVKPNCKTTSWGIDPVMLLRPAAAVRVAQYIAEWSEIENLLGLFLGILLHANQKAALAIYSDLDNRSAQLRIIESAARATLSQEHYETVSVLLTYEIRPAMRYRDKLAHWCWGCSIELPDALILREPSDKLINLANFVELQKLGQPISGDIPLNHDTLYVITVDDLDRSLHQIADIRGRLITAIGGVWDKNTIEVRSSLLNQLAETPQLRSALNRLAAKRKKSEVLRPSSPEEPSGIS